MIEESVICDGCELVGRRSAGKKRERAHGLRSRLAEQGWKNDTNVGGIGGEDWCPKCWREKVDATKIMADECSEFSFGRPNGECGVNILNGRRIVEASGNGHYLCAKCKHAAMPTKKEDR